MTQQESNINLETNIEEIHQYFPAFLETSNNITDVNRFMLHNSISNTIRRTVGWSVSNDIYDYVISKVEYRSVKNEVDSITDPVLLMKLNIICVRSIMNFFAPNIS